MEELLDPRLLELLIIGFVTLEELAEIEEYEEVILVENCGLSGVHNGYTWFIVSTIDGDYSVYVK